MNVISIKDYAKQRNVSYEAIRQQVVRYADDLGEHIIKDGRQQFLDDEAVAFLDAKRKKNPVILYEVAKDEEIERLKEEKERILLELASVQKQLIGEQQKNALLIEENKQVFLLQSDNERIRRESESAKQQIEEEKKKVSELERKEKEISFTLTETKGQLQSMTDVAEINAQERDQERLRAEAAEQEASDLQKQNKALWDRLEEVTQAKKNIFQRISDKIEKFFTE